MTALSLLTDHTYFIAPAPATEVINRLYRCDIEVLMCAIAPTSILPKQ